MEAVYILSVLIICVLPKTNGEYTCDEDWKLVGDACVGIFTKSEQKTNWYMARDKCKKLNATLITIRSSMKQSLLAPIFSGDVWIDLTKDTSSNEFYWAHGVPKADYQSWQTGQPNNGGEGCAVILGGYTRGYWADKACFNKYYYICESPSVTGGCLGEAIPLAGKCYNFSKESKSWNEAREACREIGGDLLVIENTLKNNLITEKLAADSGNRYRTFWIGASDIREEGKWRWLDQDQVVKFSVGAKINVTTTKCIRAARLIRLLYK